VLSCPSSLATVPGLGLVVLDYEHLIVFATPDAVAMASMSHVRVGWMGAVLWRQAAHTQPEDSASAARGAAREGYGSGATVDLDGSSGYAGAGCGVAGPEGDAL
jgi:hypothetical protein